MMTRNLVAIFTAALLGFSICFDAEAQRRNNNDEPEGDAESRTMSAQVGEPVLAAQDCYDNDDFTCVINTLNPLLQGQLNEYERYIILRMRGAAYYGQDRVQQAINDWLAALNVGIATQDEATSLRINIGQLYIVNEQYAQGLEQLEIAIRNGGEITSSIALLMASAYAQAERYTDGLRYAEMQFDMASPRERRNYNLLLLYYQQLNRVSDQLRLITQMVERWPGERDVWTSLVALMARTENEEGAFEANKLMYLNGMLRESRELVRLAQYYSYFEYPYRGAVIFERELNAGRIERTRENLESLASLWRQSREFDRAIPVLREIAQNGDGEDYLRLGEAYYQEGQLSEAGTALRQALNAGGLPRPGDAQALLATVLYENNDRQGALSQYRQCSQYSYSRRTCSGWVDFINNEIASEERRRVQRIRVQLEECRNEVRADLENIILVGNESNFEDGRPFVPVREDCQPYFNRFGDQIGGPGFEQASADTEEGDESDAG